MSILRNIAILFLLILNICSCNQKEDFVLLTVDDVADGRIARMKGAIGEEVMDSIFPLAQSREFSSTSEMLLALSIGKYDAAVMQNELAMKIVEEEDDYALLEESVCDSISIIVHKGRIPGRNMKEGESESIVDRYAVRIRESILAEQYWKMILLGLLVTTGIFVCGWILAMTIAVLMTLLGFVPRLRFIWKPLMFFIKTIHDVPSVVLIFFFYYIIFAQSNADGILACIVALGVYSSGSFSNVINVHLNEVDPMQHNAAQMLGLTGWKKYRLVILPQAVKTMLPLILAESKVLLRATTYAGYVSILDIVKVTELIRNQTYDMFVPLLFVSIVFLALSWLIREGLYLSYNKLFTND